MKTLKLLFALAFAVTLSLSTTACGGDDGPGTEKGNGGNGGGNGGGENGGGNENMTESEKKEFVDKTAQKLVAQINAEDFRKITDLAQYVSNNLTRGVSSSSPTRLIEDFFEAAFNACTLKNTDTYILRLFAMSYFSAEFNYRNGAWEIGSSTTPTNTLRFNFPDKNGQSCVAEVVGSGTETEVHASIFDDTKWRYQDYPPYNRYQVTTENRIKVPQKINVKLTQGNSALASINVTINVMINTNSGEFEDNSSSALETSLNADIVGYKINLSKAFYYDGNAGVDLTVSKGNTMLVKANASTFIRGRGKYVSNANVNIDVMGEVQAKGTLDDFNKIDELMKRADNAKYEETTYKNTVDQINKQFNIGIYFNGNNTRQAYIQYYPFLSKKYYDEYWKAEPVIYFDDGTSYSTLKEFGNDTRFSELIQKVKDLITDFKSLVQ